MTLLQLSDRIKQYLGIKNVSITSQHCRNFSKNYHQVLFKIIIPINIKTLSSKRRNHSFRWYMDSPMIMRINITQYIRAKDVKKLC